MKGSGFISRWDIDKNKYGVRNFAIDKLKRTMTDAQTWREHLWVRESEYKICLDYQNEIEKWFYKDK